MKTLKQILATVSLAAFTLTGTPSCQLNNVAPTKNEAKIHYIKLGEYECQFNVKTRMARLVNENKEVIAERDQFNSQNPYHWVRVSNDHESYVKCIDLPSLVMDEKDKRMEECRLLSKCTRLMWDEIYK